jgi:hypothetical protein
MAESKPLCFSHGFSLLFLGKTDKIRAVSIPSPNAVIVGDSLPEWNRAGRDLPRKTA